MVSISVINTHVQFRIRLFTYDLQKQNYSKRKEKKDTELTNVNRKLSKKR